MIRTFHFRIKNNVQVSQYKHQKDKILLSSLSSLSAYFLCRSILSMRFPYFRKKLHLRYLTWFWIRLWYSTYSSNPVIIVLGMSFHIGCDLSLSWKKWQSIYSNRAFHRMGNNLFYCDSIYEDDWAPCSCNLFKIEKYTPELLPSFSSDVYFVNLKPVSLQNDVNFHVVMRSTLH